VRKRESLLKFIYERRKGEVSPHSALNGDLNNNLEKKPSSRSFSPQRKQTMKITRTAITMRNLDIRSGLL